MPETETAEQRREWVRSADGIMALEGFEKTPEMAVLDEAVILGHITMTQKMEFLLLEARITGARSVLASIGVDDPRFTEINERLQSHQDELRAMAARMGSGIGPAFGL